MDILQVEKRIRGRVKRQMEKSQREYYLNEQVKAIQKELGEMDEDGADPRRARAERIKAARMPKEAHEEGRRASCKKLKLMSPMSAEATVVRNYIDTLGDRCRGRRRRRSPRTSPAPKRCWTKTTSAWRRSRNASSSTSPFNSAWTS